MFVYLDQPHPSIIMKQPMSIRDWNSCEKWDYHACFFSSLLSRERRYLDQTLATAIVSQNKLLLVM